MEQDSRRTSLKHFILNLKEGSGFVTATCPPCTAVVFTHDHFNQMESFSFLVFRHVPFCDYRLKVCIFFLSRLEIWSCPACSGNPFVTTQLSLQCFSNSALGESSGSTSQKSGGNRPLVLPISLPLLATNTQLENCGFNLVLLTEFLKKILFLSFFFCFQWLYFFSSWISA